ncbi:glycosyltransferase family 4 protein [Hymenobacter sp. 5516J-16]|uniref:glycosyltransferase family 4 protein n=1 Tax=Hymenobacter sp. 5516J-16 TaxID=2932253 RepID=UPI001FD468F9|nr:glycosyltransferase family 4 protein [Hymenobacter sp. 5516J-16]UOQ76176.1 glycosyltransferase family 4 protein [Hymenobacter sp. 5516J-16]
MVARGIEDKGWRYAVQAFQQVKAALPARALRLVLVGGSPYLKTLADEYATDPDIIFTGQVSNPDFYVAGFDVGLLPTYFRAEALPLAIIEYMVSGKPSIATRVGGIPELLEPSAGHTGQLVDIEAETYTPKLRMLTEAMVRYCTEPVLYAAHAAHCRQASQEFSMAACAEHYEQAFSAALHSTVNSAT